MLTISATEAHKHLGQHLSHAQVEPIKITKPGQRSVIITSESEYETFRKHYDAYCYSLAMESLEEGFASPQETKAFLEKIKNV